MRFVQACRRQSRQRRIRPGDRNDPQACRPHRLHQQRAGVADGGRSRVADESDALPGLQQRNDLFGRAPFVVLMHRNQPVRADTVMGQQMGGVARILGRNHVCGCQHFQRAQGDITQISYRGGNYI